MVPEVHDGVGSPGAPGFARVEDALGIFFAEGFHDGEIGVREGVGPGEGAHGDVVRGPGADAWDRLEFFESGGDVGAGGEEENALGDGAGEFEDRAGARGEDAEGGEVGVRDRFRGWEGGDQRREGGIDGGSESGGYAAGKRSGGGDADLLAEDGADGDLEAVEGSGDAQAGIGGGEWAEGFGDLGGATG